MLDLAKHWPQCPDGGDVSDWIKAGGDAQQLDTWIESAESKEQDDDPLLRAFAFVGDEPPAAQPMLVEDLIPLESLPFIGGQSGAGKTFIAVYFAACGWTGKPFFGREIRERVGSVFVAAEGKNMLRSRIIAALTELGENAGQEVPIAWIKKLPDFGTKTGVQAFVAELKAISAHYQKKFGVRLGLVFVDTVSASFDLEEEADNAEAAGVCKVLRWIGDEANAIAVPIHHYGKNPAVGLRGASAWRANADVVLSVTADIDPVTGKISNRQLSIAKERDGEQGPLSGFSLKWIELGEEDGKPFGSMAVVIGDVAPPAASQWPPALAIFRQAVAEAILTKGKLEKPYPDGPEVRAADVEDVKAIFAARAPVETKKSGTAEEREEARQEAIRKQFSRRLEAAIGRMLVGFKADSAGHGKIWLVRAVPDTPDTPLGGEKVSGNQGQKVQ